MDPLRHMNDAINRRQFFGKAKAGIGTIALASLLNEQLFAATPAARDALRSPTGGVLPHLHFKPRAKRVIFLFQSGGPSQFETFDPKPKLTELSGQPMPESLTQGQRVAQLQGQALRCMGTKVKFSRAGKAGVDISELLPHTATILDDITVMRSMVTEAINHDPAVTFMQSGGQQPGRPTMGAWMSYGLGSENSDLPAFIVLLSGMGNGQNLHTRYWGSGFLPSVHQGVQFRSSGDPVLYVSNPDGIDPVMRRRILDGVKEVNAMRHEAIGDPEIATRIAQYEMAYRMQTSVPSLVDVSDEPDEVFEMYGPESRKPGTFASNCLLARRLVERDVRFIQLYHRDWDHHGGLPQEIPTRCRETDQPSAALIKDLKKRGLLDDTIVIWSGEFGRTPMSQGNNSFDDYGRDHHMKCFSGWIAGAGFKRGALVGKTDDFGYNVIENPVHVHDLHATILHQLGIDHERLTYRFQGRDFRLTDVHGKVLNELLG